MLIRKNTFQLHNHAEVHFICMSSIPWEIVSMSHTLFLLSPSVVKLVNLSVNEISHKTSFSSVGVIHLLKSTHILSFRTNTSSFRVSLRVITLLNSRELRWGSRYSTALSLSNE